MKKSWLIFGMIVLPSTIVFAKKIDFDTPVKWNANVVSTALTNVGLIDSGNWDVRTTRNRILENLLARDAFSLREATTVCMDKCNMSDFLRQGQGQSHKKCPAICSSFVSNIIKVNNEQFTAIPGVSATSDSFSNLQGKSVDVCRKLMSDATKSGITYPVLCGGRCGYVGQDKIKITDLTKTKEYEVDDFCNNSKKGKDYFYILSDAKGAQDVSSLDEQQRVAKLKEAQTKPASDYMKVQAEQKKKKDEEFYVKRVEKNGYCEEMYVGNGEQYGGKNADLCIREARRFAQANACKLKSYVKISCAQGGDVSLVFCFANSVDNSKTTDKFLSVGGGLYSPVLDEFLDELFPACSEGPDPVKNYEYTPSYKDCVATFNESQCDGK